MTAREYRRGLHDLGDGCYAWLLPDGSTGLSNSGLVTGDATSLLIDTLFGLDLTSEMLEGVRAITARRPITTLVNTHSDADHVFGNELLAAHGVEIIATTAAAGLITQSAVESFATALTAPGAFGENAQRLFGAFQLEGITATGADRTFEGELSLDIGGREARLIQVGPAHTPGDAIVYIPDARVLYSGDILFVGATPIVWMGPIGRWIAALDLILDLDVRTIVPGHGPISTKADIGPLREYLLFVEREARKRFEDGQSYDEAIVSIDLGAYRNVPEYGRFAQNVLSVYRELDPQLQLPGRLGAIARMATLEGFPLSAGEFEAVD